MSESEKTGELNFDIFAKFYVLEKHRLNTFKKWPFEDNAKCSRLKMAEAGFYFSGNERDVDTVTCFVCAKTLDGWELDDDPWKEHEKHAPQCMFVKMRRPEKDLLVKDLIEIIGSIAKEKISQQFTCINETLKKECAEDMTLFLGKTYIKKT